MKRGKRILSYLLATALAASIAPLAAAAPEEARMDGVAKAPNVTSEMCAAEFWQQKESCSDEVLLTQDEIAAFNRSLFAVEGTHTNDLSAFEGTFDGEAIAERCASFESPEGLYLTGAPVPESYYEAIRENIRSAPVAREMPDRFGFAVNRTAMKEYPYEDYLSEKPADPEWDELTGTGILVNEPLVLLFPSADGKFTLVYSQCYFGWAPSEDIAVCESKAEWESCLRQHRTNKVVGRRMNFSSDASADSEGLLEVSRGICARQMAEKASSDVPPICVVLP